MLEDHSERIARAIEGLLREFKESNKLFREYLKAHGVELPEPPKEEPPQAPIPHPLSFLGGQVPGDLTLRARHIPEGAIPPHAGVRLTPEGRIPEGATPPVYPGSPPGNAPFVRDNSFPSPRVNPEGKIPEGATPPKEDK